MGELALIPWRFCPSQFGCWKLAGTKMLICWQNAVVQLITKQDQDWSVLQNNMESEPIYTTHREADTLRCPPQTYSSHSLIRRSLPISLLICNLCGPSCPWSRKSLSVGEATVWRRFSSREHRQAGTRLHGLAHYWLCSYSLQLRAGGGSRWGIFGTHLFFLF